MNGRELDPNFDVCSMPIGFLDAEGRVYVFEGKECWKFYDDTGEMYQIDKKRSGYCNEKKNHFQFDDSQLCKYKKPSDVLCSVKKAFGDDIVLPDDCNPVNHPIKRQYIIFATDLQSDEEDGNAEDETMDDKEKIDRYPAKVGGKKKNAKSDRKKVASKGKNAVRSPNKPLPKRLQPKTNRVDEEATNGDISMSAVPNKPGTKIVESDSKSKRKTVVRISTEESFTSARRRAFAKSLIELGEKGLTEFFLRVDKCGGRQGLERLAMLLEDRATSLSEEEKEKDFSLSLFTDTEEEKQDDDDDDDCDGRTMNLHKNSRGERKNCAGDAPMASIKFLS